MEAGLKFYKDGKLCSSWILRIVQGSGDASQMLGAGNVSRCVQLFQSVLWKRRGVAFLSSRRAARVVLVRVKIVPGGTSNAF